MAKTLKKQPAPRKENGRKRKNAEAARKYRKKKKESGEPVKKMLLPKTKPSNWNNLDNGRGGSKPTKRPVRNPKKRQKSLSLTHSLSSLQVRKWIQKVRHAQAKFVLFLSLKKAH